MLKIRFLKNEKLSTLFSFENLIFLSFVLIAISINTSIADFDDKKINIIFIFNFFRFISPIFIFISLIYINYLSPMG